MATTTDLTPARVSSWRRVRRWLACLTLGYIGILIVILALESWFIYRPITAAQSWIEPTDPAIRDVYFDLPTGERIHAFWLPRAGATRAVLYCHGNAGNVSH